MNKYIIGVAVVAVLVVGFAVINSDSEDISKTPAIVTSALAIGSDSFDFGEIDIFGGKVKTSYLIENQGSEDVVITSAVTSCMCTEGEIDGFKFGMHGSSGKSSVIAAGGQKLLTATFDPLAHGPEGVGPITRELFIETNSSVTPELTFRFSANVVKN